MVFLSGVPFLEAGTTVPITLDTNRADLISVKVADYLSIGSSTKVTILVQVGGKRGCSDWHEYFPGEMFSFIS